MPTYDKAPKKILDQVERTMKKHQKELYAAKVEVSVLMAHANTDKDGNPTGVAVKLHGRRCLGTIQITALKLRALGVGDALMILDGDRYKDLSTAAQLALIDHELEHLRVRWESMPNPDDGSEGIPKRDDLGRPRMKMREHDWELAGFASVMDRHGKAAIEFQQLMSLKSSHPQALLPFYNQADQEEQTQEEVDSLPEDDDDEDIRPDALKHPAAKAAAAG